MHPSPEQFCSRIRAAFPLSRPTVTNFPSGAFMIDVQIGDEVHVVEYLPSLAGFGVSRRSTAVFGWEGVEHAFESMADVEAFVVALLEKEPNKAPEPTPTS